MEEAVADLIHDLAFQLDEVRASEWEGRKTKLVIIPTSLRGHTIYHGVNQNPEDITIVTLMAVSWEPRSLVV
jgi:hypothetical protein